MNHKDYSLFYFATIDRSFVLEPHKFYVDEAIKRLLSQFSDIDSEAESREKTYLEKAGKNFNPDVDDAGSIFENAHQEGVSHWLALNDMKNTVALALTAGLFHQFDKTLREITIKEFSHWLPHEIISSVLWDVGFPRLIELLEWVGMNIIGTDFYRKINACRLVVNVYKHGDGDAHRELSTNHPEYYQDINKEYGYVFKTHYEDLEISQEQFIELGDAITAFWNNIPIHCMHSQIRAEPVWFEEFYIKHEKKVKKLKSQNP